jgi:glutathione synthase/RimK-type ligase-like ATP-grasp enzyme
MKIAIHHIEHSFSERWIDFCIANKIPYKLVNCYDSDIVEKMKDCDGLMWHWSHADPKAIHFARQLTYSLEACGKKVFPNANTVWHFDDKVGQKYLLETIKAPLIPSYVFYTKKEAYEWAKTTSFPKVFKLKVGAGSRNVWLLKDFKKARKFINKSFKKGFKLSDPFIELKDRYSKFLIHKNKPTFVKLLKGVGRLFFVSELQMLKLREKGYAYFQDFIPDNSFDMRVVTIGDRAFVLKRIVRSGDFRASGSGTILYPGNEINTDIIKTSFETTDKIGAQCLAYDFVKNEKGESLIIEISYAFSMLAYDKCLGYWDRELNWHPEPVNAPLFMIQDFVKNLKE